MAQGQEAQTGDPEQATYNETGQPEAALSSVPLFTIETDAETEARRYREGQTEQRELDDLAAQKGMNEAAQRMADYSLYQTILVFFGTVALIWTLILTGRTAEAAMSANRITQAGQRPWLVLSLEIDSIDMAGDWFSPCGRLVIKNIGKTAAHCVSTVDAYPFGEAVKDRHASILKSVRDAAPIFYVMPGQEVRRQLFFSNEPLANTVIYVTSAVSYRWEKMSGLTSSTWMVSHTRPDVPGSMSTFAAHGHYGADEFKIIAVPELSVVE